MGNNLMFGMWSNGIMRIFCGNECIYEKGILREVINDTSNCSNCTVSSYTYPMETNEEGTLLKSIYVAFSLCVNNSKTILKLYDLCFSGFKASRANDAQYYNFKTD